MKGRKRGHFYKLIFFGAARCARGGWGAPRRRASARPRCRVTCVAAGAPLFPLPLRGAGFDWRGGEAGGCGFPRLGFPPAPPFPGLRPLDSGHASGRERPPGGAPFECGSSAGGKPIPVHSLTLPHWGQPHGGQFCPFFRRPPPGLSFPRCGKTGVGFGN